MQSHCAQWNAMQCSAVRGRDESALSDHSDDNETETFFLRFLNDIANVRRARQATDDDDDNIVVGKRKNFSNDDHGILNMFEIPFHAVSELESFFPLSSLSPLQEGKVFISSR